MYNNKDTSKVGGGASVLDKVKAKYTKKQFGLISRFLSEKPRVCILSGG